MTTFPSEVGPKENRSEASRDPSPIGLGYHLPSLGLEQRRAEPSETGADALFRVLANMTISELGLHPEPKKSEEIPDPDFRSVGLLIGPQFLYDALRRRNFMYELLDEGDTDNVEEAIDIAEEIVSDFPTEDVRRWMTRGKDVREELKRRCQDYNENSFEKLMPGLGVSTKWALSDEWYPHVEADRDAWQSYRRLLIARRYLKNDFGTRLADTIFKISAYMPSDTRLLPEDLRYIDEEIELDGDDGGGE